MSAVGLRQKTRCSCHLLSFSQLRRHAKRLVNVYEGRLWLPLDGMNDPYYKDYGQQANVAMTNET